MRLALVLAARRAGLPAPVDGLTPGTQDRAQLQADAARGGVVRSAGGGVFRLDGRMVDAPVVRFAQRTLAQSRLVAEERRVNV